ncbi:uncharacterized protein DS421_5g167240 [Arachis hypogaea]|nr:uncharacterized protein DS421_5g167240 [Arachis hypogaea]
MPFFYEGSGNSQQGTQEVPYQGNFSNHYWRPSSLPTLLFWKYAYASFCALEQKMAMGLFKKPQIPDLNFHAPRKDEAGPFQMRIMQKIDGPIQEVSNPRSQSPRTTRG